MPVITINHRSYRVDRKKPLLDSLLERGEQLPYSCRSGVCHACMLKVQSGKPPEQSQNQLNHQQKSNGYFLACQCHPSENMSVSLPVTDLIPGIISGKTIHSPTTATLEITPKFPVGFMPGQQLTVQVNKQLISNVYPAACPDSGKSIHLYIQRSSNDPFSIWAYEDAIIGAHVLVTPPKGKGLNWPLHQSLVMISQENAITPLLGLLHYHRTRTTGQVSTQLYLCLWNEDNLDSIRNLFSAHQSLSIQTVKSASDLKELRKHLLSLPKEQYLILSGNQGFIEHFKDASTHFKHYDELSNK